MTGGNSGQGLLCTACRIYPGEYGADGEIEIRQPVELERSDAWG